MTGISQARLESYEADDVVASAAWQSTADHVIVVSGDKDLSQLQGPKISFYDLHQKIILSRRAICERFNVHHPAHVAIALAIQGDSGDGISGVKGWGAGKVKKLFGNIPPEKPFDQVVEGLLGLMTDEQQSQFLACLEVTLLDVDIKGVPEAAPIALNASLVAELEENLAMSWAPADNTHGHAVVDEACEQELMQFIQQAKQVRN
jgi:5'-3' exonuclease